MLSLSRQSRRGLLRVGAGRRVNGVGDGSGVDGEGVGDVVTVADGPRVGAMVDVGAASVGVGVGGTGVVAGGVVNAALRAGPAVGVSVGGTGVGVGVTVVVGDGLARVMMRGVGPGVGVSCLGAIIYSSPTMATIATTANMPKPTIHFKTPVGAAMPVG